MNSEGETPLSRAQVWKGLVLKARDARLFLPPNLCTRCEVVGESETHIVREATIAGEDLREIIAFEPESKVTFSCALQRITKLTSSKSGIVFGPQVAVEKRGPCRHQPQAALRECAGAL